MVNKNKCDLTDSTRQTPTDGSRDCNETCRMLVPIVQVRTIPASVDVDWQLDVAPHRLLEHGAVCVVVALGVQRQLALVGTNGHLATQHHSVTPPHECAAKSLKTASLLLSLSSINSGTQFPEKKKFAKKNVKLEWSLLLLLRHKTVVK